MIGLSTLFRTTLLALTLLSSSLVVAAAESATVAVNDIRLGVTAERTRLVLDLGAKVDFDIFLLDRPRRVVVDLPSLAWPTDQPTVDGLVQKIRFGQFTADKSRLVIDAKGPVRVVKSFLLPPSSGLPHRLVIDLVKTGNKEFADQVA
ncbi:AMIN domain-containing protein, partial [Alphaproteobacteria bacterium]|nr:AMIN domain-containing protein [Alphaproteobacteria bacterium]